MPEQTPPQRARPRWTIISVALLVLGLLILIPSGLCTAFFGWQLVLSGNFFASNAGIVRQFLLFGCIAMTIGAGLIFGAFETRRRE